MASVRVLYLSPRECWPPNSGAKLRDYHFARGLASGADLTYLFFGTPETAAQLAAELGHSTEVIAVAPPAKYSPAKIAKGLVGNYPLPVLNYTSPEMAASLSQILARDSFDMVHIDSIHFAAYLHELTQKLRGTKLILNWHNIESELMRRYAASTSSFARKAYATRTAGQMKRLEQRMLSHCFAHVVCSEREQTILGERDTRARIAVVPNGVDTSYFVPHAPHRESANRLVFVGQMSYHPNAAGAQWFVKEVWPLLKSQQPELELSIVGANPGPTVRALADASGIQVTGTVPDVRPFYSGAYAAIVPLLTGGGTRLKILEAMAAGIPVISSRLGAEGLPVSDRHHILFAENPGEWHQALQFLNDPSRRASLVQQARQLVLSQFDWQAIGNDLLRLYETWSRTGRAA